MQTKCPDEVEVTPEMMSAGASALSRALGAFDEELVAREVYRTMRVLEPSEEEVEKRRDDALKRVLRVPPKGKG